MFNIHRGTKADQTGRFPNLAVQAKTIPWFSDGEITELALPNRAGQILACEICQMEFVSDDAFRETYEKPR